LKPSRFALAALCLSMACGERRSRLSSVERPLVVRSNILRADTAGSDACAGCHAEIYEKWRHSPRHEMTRLSSAIRAPFDGASFEFMGDRAEMFSEHGERFMRLSSPRYGSGLYRIEKRIGGRYREDFVGVEVSSTSPDSPARSAQRILPVSYLLFDSSWRYKGYSVLSPARDGLKLGLSWQKTCILCHNSAPHFVALYDEMIGASSPGYQGSASLELPPERGFRYRVTDPDALEAALDAELGVLGTALPDDLEQSSDQLEFALNSTRSRFDEHALTELGVGCETCHGGSRAHAEQPSRFVPSYGIRSEFLEVSDASGGSLSRALEINRGCARCHTVLFSRYPYTWEGRERSHDPGGSSMNSGEARDFLLGGCAGELSCSSCHDPHTVDTPAHYAELEQVSGNAVCTSCHAEFAASPALARHTHHDTAGAGSVCINCHMPKKNVALDYRLTRYHRIGSPSDPERVEGDRPLECALCHVDKSVGQLVGEIERWWKKRYDPSKLRRLYGEDLDANVMLATLERGKPHERIVAMDRLGSAENGALNGTPSTRAGGPHAEKPTEALLRALGDEYPLARFFAHRALEHLEKRDLVVNLHAPGDELERSVRNLLAVPPPAPSPSVPFAGAP
jgi:predicted CXXCH cytochrome family protein